MKTFTIQRRIPSQNRFNNKRGMAAQYEYGKERNWWFALIRAHLVPCGTAPDMKIFCRIVSYRNRLLDYGNLVGGAKPIPDVLKRLNWIKDDSPKWFECEYHQRQVPEAEERTEITLATVAEWSGFHAVVKQ